MCRAVAMRFLRGRVAVLLAVWLAGTGCVLAQASRLEVFLGAGRYLEAAAEAVASVEQARAGPDRARAALRAGQVYLLYLEMPDRAAGMFRRALDEAPSSPAAGDAHYFLGRIAYERGDYREAARRFRTVVARFPKGPRTNNARFLLEMAEQALQEGVYAPPETPAYRLLSRRVRVLIVEAAREVALDAAGALQAADGSGRSFGTFGEPVRAVASGGRVFLDGRTTGSGSMVVWSTGPVRCGGRRFRGRVRLAARGDVLDAVEEADVEDYLRGVVPREMSPSWPFETLKAQAVASRTYVLYQAAHAGDRAYDVRATVASQVYGGVESEATRTDRAVRETAGEVLICGGKPILAYFHAHSGGVVADDAEVWPVDLPYLKARRDPYVVGAPERVARWELRLPARAVGRALGRSGAVSGISADTGGPSGRVRVLQARVGGRVVRMRGARFRQAVGPDRLRSTLFTVREHGGEMVFQGRGYGHGVGMSQWGARGMALQGKGYSEILHYYYPGTVLERLEVGR